MTDTYKCVDLGRQLLVSLISRVSSLDLKINVLNVSVYLSLLVFFSLSGTLPTNIKPKRESCSTFRLASFTSLNSTNGGQTGTVVLYFDTKSLFIPRSIMTLTGILHKKKTVTFA